MNPVNNRLRQEGSEQGNARPAILGQASVGQGGSAQAWAGQKGAEANFPKQKEGAFVRLFYALWPCPECARSLALRQKPLEGKKGLADDLHLTLAFLGNQPRHLLPTFDAIGQRLGPWCEPLVFDRYGSFGGNKVVWAGFSRVPKALINLHNALVEGLQQQAIEWRDDNRFVPHVTLARKANLPEGLAFDPVNCTQLRLCLAASNAAAHQFGSGTPRYQIITTYDAAPTR